MTLLRDSPDDLLALCGAAADSLGIPEPAFVEKDFWVVELLRSVVRPLDLEPVNNIPCSATVSPPQPPDSNGSGPCHRVCPHSPSGPRHQSHAPAN
jgi:hypothetical protein